MAHLRIFPTIVVVSVAVIVASMVCYPGGVQCAFRDMQNYSDFIDFLEKNHETQQQLHEKNLLLNVRIQIKDALIEDLIHGRTTLMAVASQFHALNAEMPCHMIILQMQHPNVSGLELAALNVIDFVEIKNLPAAQHRKVMARLRREFQRAFGHHYQTVH
jgi:hypothetical protein